MNENEENLILADTRTSNTKDGKIDSANAEELQEVVQIPTNLNIIAQILHNSKLDVLSNLILMQGK